MNTRSNITTAYRKMAQDSYDEAIAAQTIVLESASLEEVSLTEQAVKTKIIKDGYIYFPDDDLLYKVSPYKNVGNSGKLATLGVQKWYSVKVAVGEDLAEYGIAQIDNDEKGSWFTVASDNNLYTPALISSEPDKIFL